MPWPKGKPAHNKGVQRDPVERFWRFVEKSDGCWLWTGHTISSPGGTRYGGFRSTRQQNSIRAHRYAFQLAYGPIPVGMLVLHTCDVGICVRPDHLYLGTAKDNARDRDSRGRANTARGEKAGGAKLTGSQVLQIRESYGRGNKQRDIAAEYGVTQSAISRIVNARVHV